MSQAAPEARESQTRQGLRIMALVCVGHAVSNFYALCLPPLIPFLKEDFGVSYAALGLLISVRSFTAGALQLPMGFLVDRIGAKVVLMAGIALMSAGFGLIAVAPGYWSLLALTCLLGAGMATLRPSNYTIINAAMPPAWMGRAFGANLFAGHIGRAVAPPTIVFLAALWDWRIGVGVAGLVGLAIMGTLMTQWRAVRTDRIRLAEAGAEGPSLLTQVRTMASPTIVLFFAFYTLTAFTMNGLQSFTVVALQQLHGTPLALASGALTAFLVASALGVLAGGFMADKTSRHDTMAVVVLMGSAALLILLGAMPLPVVVIVVTMAAIGLFQGAMRPARDMMLRAILPREAFGKAIGMVSTGAAIGGGIAPVAFGWIMDIGEPAVLFYVLGGAIIVLAGIVMVPKARVSAAVM